MATDSTNSKEAKVRAFFNRPTAYHAYLEKRFGVEVRAYLVRKLLGVVSGSTILDLGCGDGSLSLQYATQENQLTLIDLSDKMLEAARQNTPAGLVPTIQYLNLDFFEYAPDQPFDIVLCIGVLAHLPSLELAVKKLSSLLKPGGRCLIQLTDHDSWVAKINALYYSVYQTVAGNPYQYPLQCLSSSEALRVFQQQDFKVVSQRRYSLLLPGMGRLPDKFLYRYQLATVESRWLSKFGSEVIMLLVKS